MDRQRFRELVEEELALLPKIFRKRLRNVAILVEDSPPGGPEREGLLLGLFHGVPLTDKTATQPTPPDRIFLYQKNIEAVCSTEREIRRQIRSTLRHEVGHYFGLGEEELEDI